MAIEIVSFPMKNGGSFHSYVSLPEGTYNYFVFLTYMPQMLLQVGQEQVSRVPKWVCLKTGCSQL